jgi:hypothetical protein
MNNKHTGLTKKFWKYNKIFRALCMAVRRKDKRRIKYWSKQLCKATRRIGVNNLLAPAS